MPRRKLYARRVTWMTHNATITDPETDTLHAEIYNATWKETGTITYAATREKHEVTHKSGSGVWQLMPAQAADGAEPIATATKPKAMRRYIELDFGGVKYVMKSRRAGGVDFVVTRSLADTAGEAGAAEPAETGGKRDEADVLVGELVADNCWRKGYTLSIDEDVAEHLPEFCYWLGNTLNKRDTWGNAAAAT